MKKINLWCTIAASLLFHFSSAQDYTPSYIRQGNGINGIFSVRNDLKRIKLDLVIKVGSVYEPDSLSGIAYITQNIIANKISAAIRNGKYGLNMQNAEFSATTTSERTTFQLFLSSSTLLQPAQQLFHDSIYAVKVTDKELEAAVSTMREERIAFENNPTFNFEEKLKSVLFGKDHYKLNIYGKPEHYKNIDAVDVNRYMKKYYLPNNIIIMVSGSFDLNAAVGIFENVFRGMLVPEFDPESYTKFINFKPMVYSSSFIHYSDDSLPELEICYMLPGVRNNIPASYSGFLLTAILNDKENYIQQKALKLGCRDLSVRYEALNLSGILRIVIKARQNNFVELYDMVTKELKRIDETLVNESMLNAGKLIFKKEYTQLAKSPEYPDWIVKYWMYEDEKYFPVLLDSVMGVSEKTLRKFTIDFIKQNAFCVGLKISKEVADEIKVDSLFPTADISVFDYTFRYRQNITTIENQADTVQLQRMLRWLQLNPEGSIQANGFSDEGEFYKATDDSIMNFIDSMPGFSKTAPDVVRKRYLRPDLMRAMKIVKYFYDAGIEPGRLRGTGMKFTSDNKDEARDNMKCIISFDFNKKSPSPFDYYTRRREF
jgi:predicted Zn-dependent peptidase